MKTMTFVRDFAGFSGGHLKVFDYYCHVAKSGIFQPGLVLTARSLTDETNPWIQARMPFSETFEPSDAYFLGGMDWDILDQAGVDLEGRPVINLIQGVRHAFPDDMRYRFLSRPALRICVSEDVADTVRATGMANGDVVTIPNGIDTGVLYALRDVAKPHDVFIGGLKSPALAQACAERLRAKGLKVDLEINGLPRDAYIRRVASARIALLLPLPAEGFYLPALEAMAMDVSVVVPDCGGNRSFCHDGVNAVIPLFELEALTQAVIDLAASPETQAALKHGGRLMVAAHDLIAERARFLEILERFE